MGLSVGLVATALSSNIPTGVLVDCCFFVSSAVFQLFVFFSGFTALNSADIQQSSRIFIGGKGRVTGMALQFTPPRGDAHWAVSRCPKRRGGGFGVFGGGYSTKKLIT